MILCVWLEETQTYGSKQRRFMAIDIKITGGGTTTPLRHYVTKMAQADEG